MSDRQMLDLGRLAADFLYRQGVGDGSCAVDELVRKHELLTAQRDAMRALLERLMADEVAHPKRAIRTCLNRCDDWASGSLPIGENLP